LPCFIVVHPTEGCKHAQTVWKKSNIKSLKEHHDLCKVSDALLLSGISDNVRQVLLQPPLMLLFLAHFSKITLR